MTRAAAPAVVIRELRPGEEDAACSLVRRVFDEYVGVGFSPEGVAEFKGFAEPAAMATRREQDCFAMVAEAGEQLAGVIEIRACTHVCLLFVESDQQGRGIARRLFEAALDRCRSVGREPARVTVNSSRFALPMYEALGFERAGEEREVHGIVHVPMEAVF